MHSEVALQVLPHLPQFFGSEDVSTHISEQAVSSWLQVGAPPPLPLEALVEDVVMLPPEPAVAPLPCEDDEDVDVSLGSSVTVHAASQAAPSAVREARVTRRVERAWSGFMVVPFFEWFSRSDCGRLTDAWHERCSLSLSNFQGVFTLR